MDALLKLLNARSRVTVLLKKRETDNIHLQKALNISQSIAGKPRKRDEKLIQRMHTDIENGELATLRKTDPNVLPKTSSFTLSIHRDLHFMIELLSKKGNDPDHIRTPEACLTLLALAGADLNVVDARAESSLMRAVRVQIEAMASLLCEVGARVDLVDRHGNSAPHCAVESDGIKS
jgi:hypothetical protein